MPWKLTVRFGPRVERHSFSELSPALSELEQRAQALAGNAPGRSLDTKVRRFEPAEQVVARIELAGPERFLTATRAGVDVRGDGSVVPYRGRVRRQLIEVGHGQSPYEALRRALG